MTDITIADVLQHIKHDLDWRGPNGRTLGHICLERAEAEYAHNWILRLCKAKDDMEVENEMLKNRLKIEVETRQKLTRT